MYYSIRKKKLGLLDRFRNRFENKTYLILSWFNKNQFDKKPI